MDHHQQQQLDTQLRQNWSQLRHQILDQFAQVSTSDLDTAVNVTDLIQRIADKTDYSERFVETRITELVGVGQGTSSSLGGQQPYASQASGQPFGQTQQGTGSQGRLGSNP